MTCDAFPDRPECSPSNATRPWRGLRWARRQHFPQTTNKARVGGGTLALALHEKSGGRAKRWYQRWTTRKWACQIPYQAFGLASSVLLWAPSFIVPIERQTEVPVCKLVYSEPALIFFLCLDKSPRRRLAAAPGVPARPEPSRDPKGPVRATSENSSPVKWGRLRRVQNSPQREPGFLHPGPAERVCFFSTFFPNSGRAFPVE